MYFKENHHTAIIKKEDWIKVQKLLSERHSTAKRATLRRLSNHFVAYRVKDGLFKGYLIMDSRRSFMERQEFMKNVDEAQKHHENERILTMNFDFSALNFETIDSNINAYPDIFLKSEWRDHHQEGA